MNDFENIAYRVEDGAAIITLNRPGKLNAVSVEMFCEVVEAIDLADADDAVRAVIVTGAGRAFCAGADLSKGTGTFDYAKQGEFREKYKVNGVYRDWGGWLTLRIFNSLKPFIAAVNGPAAGHGATMQCAMDFRLAVPGAKYVFPFVRRGIVPEAASSWFLTQIVGLPTALDWSLTGRTLLSEEAHERGFIHSLHAPDELLPAAMKIAREISDNCSPVAVALTRRMFWRLACASHPMEAHEVDSRAIQLRGASADSKEGIASFLEKRKPNFTDKVSDGLPEIFPGWKEPEFR